MAFAAHDNVSDAEGNISADGNDTVIGRDPLTARNLASDGVASFDVIMERLSEIRSLHSNICGDLSSFADLVGHSHGGESELEALEHAISDARGALEDVALSSSTNEEKGHHRKASSYLQRIDTISRSLKAVATLTRTAAASLGVTSLNRYLADLTATAHTISNSASQVSVLVQSLAGREKQTKESCQAAARALQVLAPRLAERRNILAELAEREGRVARTIAKRARILSADGKTQLKSFVTAMQFSDRLAQRLDHFASMLEHDDGNVMRLAAAQARSMQRDLAEVIHQVGETMSALVALGRQGASLFNEGEIADAISATVTKRSEVVDLVLTEYAKVQQTLETVQADAAFASDTAQEAAISFKTLEASSKSVAIASINSMLLSARLGHARGPLSVLSAEVRETATKCLAAVGGSQASLNAMTSSVQDMQGNLETSSAALGQTVDALAGLTEQSEKRFVQIQTLSKRSGASSEGLLSLVEGVETALSAASMIGERLLSLAVQLEALPVDGAPDPAVFATIWDSYTMDEERIVHADCFAGNPDLEINEPEAGQISDDIDDLLF